MVKQEKKARRNDALITMIGNNIKYYRDLRGLSFRELATIADMETKMLWEYEQGKVNLNVTMLSVIAEALELEIHVLLLPTPG